MEQPHWQIWGAIMLLILQKTVSQRYPHVKLGNIYNAWRRITNI